MNYKIILISILLLITSCKKLNNKNQNTNIDLTFLNTHVFNIENGKNIFNKSCITCHLYGTAGAITIKDKKSWKKLLTEKTTEEIYLNILNGYAGEKGPMPRKGACNKCSETDLFDTLEYMLSVNGFRCY